MRELSDSSVSDHIAALRDYLARGGSVAAWFASKGFCQADEAVIRAELQQGHGCREGLSA